MQKLNWNSLLSKKRNRDSSATMENSKENNTKIVARNEFEADYDRIVGSSSVRRLQDKAQVFPLQENDFTRTRLTHSIEVSAMARSLGKAVGRKLEDLPDSSFSAQMTDELAALLQTAGLIHDIGNPPFGHYGETIIRDWFSEWFVANKLLSRGNVLTTQEKNDFIYFDGNVQNLRIVTKLQTLNDAHGANFTYATLATIIKYPWKSDNRKPGKKKFGYFKSEEDIVKKIYQETGICDGQRHPATYLLEAADDIIYLCDDIEDGVKKGYINWEKEYAKLNEACDDDKYQKLFQKINSKVPDSNMVDSEIETARVRNFRNLTQSYLFEKVVQTFMDNYKDIMDGTYNGNELLKCEDKMIKELKKITCDNCFCCHEVLALELVGDKVIKNLLDIFVTALTENQKVDLEDTTSYAGKIYKLFSSNFTYVALHNYETNSRKDIQELSLYDKLHLVTDFISGMTDSYAVNLYKELAGIKLPQ